MTEEKKSEKTGNKFWPYSTKLALVFTSSFAVLLFVLCVLLKTRLDWPPDDATGTFLIVIAVISLIPILLIVLDVVKAHGGTIGLGYFEIDFSKVQSIGVKGFIIQANNGVRGQPVSDSGTDNILEALKEATGNSIVVIDLEDGQAWWETRLLVLLSGASRKNCPDKIVFVGTKGGNQQSFIGWANPNDLLRLMLNTDKKYLHSFYLAKSVHAQWNLVEPAFPLLPQNLPPFLWMQAEAVSKQRMLFDYKTALPNMFFQEQVLQNQLGRVIEEIEGNGRPISINRLNELFESVLKKNFIDESLTIEEQTKASLSDDHSHIALVKNGIYSSLVSRYAIINEALKGIIK